MLQIFPGIATHAATDGDLVGSIIISYCTMEPLVVVVGRKMIAGCYYYCTGR